MHPNDIVQIVSELRALMVPEIKTIIKDNTPDTETIVYHAVKKATECLTKHPVVQSVVSLTTSLRVISLTVLADSIYNILIFFAEKT